MTNLDSYVLFETLLGKTLVSIEGGGEGGNSLIFTTTEKERFKLFHYQNCCESVYIEDIIGDLQGLIGEPLLVAEQVNGAGCPPLYKHEESFTWTFYKLDTRKGGVTIRWYGSSSDYYSDSVDLIKLGV